MASQNFLSKVFGRNDEVIGAIGEVTGQQASMFELVRGIQSSLEMMETRLTIEINKISKNFEDELAEIKKIAINGSPKEVVKAIEGKTQEEKKQRQYRAIRVRLESTMAKYLVNDLPLYKENARYKNAEITPQGLAVYEAISEFLIKLAKVSGKSKEQFTNYGRYRKFFRIYGIKPYTKMTVRRSDGTTMSTLLAAVIVNGHVRQYLDYILGILKEETKCTDQQ
ncbi:hypothetical protein [Bacillus chungangensis]|uniref:Uncharacterized protein n=1 Tax=Bacillus chungangensis TaxID=587633 RepID=A0ABT9WME4_9BACI|nr:hypothetical protein [Bacillus chungangensis]MDQ0174459.1 hypothetical protein [Bacillus chungangensis]